MNSQLITFAQRLEGRFDGLVRQQDVRHLAKAMVQWDGWYLLEPQAPLPEQSVAGEVARQHLETLVEEILREERGVWTTMVYVQSIDEPWIVKVFHPRRAGCGCGGQGGVLPWWVLSRIKPEVIAAWQAPVCATSASQAWWKKWL